ncbi:MAG: dynamin family protein [Pseudomonadota bacterium]
MAYFVEGFVSKIKDVYASTLDPIAEQFLYQRPPTLGELKRPPLVLVLGNHSSGKSSFINYMLGEDVQNTGVAPTDDDFTIITHGNVEDDRDGPSVVSNPDLPYEELRHFGDNLVSHVRLKRRSIDLLRNVTLIDSPGMIDEAKAESGRGFDFPGVVRWFAERADLVMIFFDPDKPGTTGETLQVFNKSLTGIDHKLLIVMNKMDQFRNLHDFARACGALCWNLGKVIPRKDLPLIYNTFVPLHGQPDPALPMADFEKARENLINELHRAPARRLDNMITQMQTFAERLRLHTVVIDAAARELARGRRIFWALLILAVGGGSAAAFFTGFVPAIPLIAGAGLIVAAIYEFWLLRRARKRKATRLEETFEKLYDLELLVRDRSDDLRMLWEQIHPRARDVASKRGLQTFPRLKKRDRERLNQLIEQDIPRLRSDLYEKLNTQSMADRSISPPQKAIANEDSPKLLHAGE